MPSPSPPVDLASEREAWIVRAVAAGMTEAEARTTADKMRSFQAVPTARKAPKQPASSIAKPELSPAPQKAPASAVTLSKREDLLIQTSADIWQDSPEELAFQHIVLCHLGFPRSKTDAREFTRKSGTALMKLKAGEIYDGTEFVPQPLPYGAIPRLVMIAAVTKAVQQKTRTIELGRSMSESLRNLGLADTGGAHWRNVIKQQQALAAVELVLGYMVEGQPRTLKTPPFDEITAWVNRDDAQASLFPSQVVLSERFFEALRENAVPLDVRAVRALGRYPMALDVYTWLAHRLCRVRKAQGDRISWMTLREQFGHEIGDQKDFKKTMRDALHRALMVYPAAKIERWGSGITLLPSPPPVQKTQVLVGTGLGITL
jgi:hypothetical protein